LRTPPDLTSAASGADTDAYKRSPISSPSYPCHGRPVVTGPDYYYHQPELTNGPTRSSSSRTTVMTVGAGRCVRWTVTPQPYYPIADLTTLNTSGDSSHLSCALSLQTTSDPTATPCRRPETLGWTPTSNRNPSCGTVRVLCGPTDAGAVLRNAALYYRIRRDGYVTQVGPDRGFSAQSVHRSVGDLTLQTVTGSR